MKTFPVGEARRRLPELIRRVAGGQGAVAIGRRGRPEVMLIAAGARPRAVERRPLPGLVEIVGTDDDLAHSQQQLRRIVEESLTRTAAFITRGRAARVRRKRR